MRPLMVQSALAYRQGKDARLAIQAGPSAHTGRLTCYAIGHRPTLIGTGLRTRAHASTHGFHAQSGHGRHMAPRSRFRKADSSRMKQSASRYSDPGSQHQPCPPARVPSDLHLIPSQSRYCPQAAPHQETCLWHLNHPPYGHTPQHMVYNPELKDTFSLQLNFVRRNQITCYLHPSFSTLPSIEGTKHQALPDNRVLANSTNCETQMVDQ
jgi:hypothetical protein